LIPDPISVYTGNAREYEKQVLEKMMKKAINPQEVERKPYSRPAITHELELETRAGSPTGIEPLDFLPKV
jgi:hypothetical protein